MLHDRVPSMDIKLNKFKYTCSQAWNERQIKNEERKKWKGRRKKGKKEGKEERKGKRERGKEGKKEETGKEGMGKEEGGKWRKGGKLGREEETAAETTVTVEKTPVIAALQACILQCEHMHCTHERPGSSFSVYMCLLQYKHLSGSNMVPVFKDKTSSSNMAPKSRSIISTWVQLK